MYQTMTNQMIPANFPMKRGSMVAAKNEIDSGMVERVNPIIDMTLSLPVEDKYKLSALIKLMCEVQSDQSINVATRDAIVANIHNAMTTLDPDTQDTSEKYPDTMFDPDGILDDHKKEFNAKPIMVMPSKVLHYNAMATLNMYCYIGMPCLVCLTEDFGMCTYVNNISYEFIMQVAANPNIDKVYFTDGVSIAVVK